MVPINWPAGLEPKFVPIPRNANAPLPKADAVLSAFTFAEGQALADTWTPGHQLEDWNYYAHLFAGYEDLLTGRSPARESKRLASFALVTVGTKRVLLVKFELHPDTDGPSIPTSKLWQQIFSETGARLILSHGTAGAVQSTTVLGDVIVAKSVRWDCRQRYEHEPFAGKSYECTPLSSLTPNMELAQSKLIPANAGNLKPIATRDPVIWLGFDTITTDFFAFDDAENYYGLRTFDSNARAVEMDDAALGMAIQEAFYATSFAAPDWFSLRNASDPQIAQSTSIRAENKEAGEIYDTKGYFTTIGSSIVGWAMIADMAE
jgi:hypothetical protein